MPRISAAAGKEQAEEKKIWTEAWKASWEDACDNKVKKKKTGKDKSSSGAFEKNEGSWG